jgi:hypothetical protein
MIESLNEARMPWLLALRSGHMIVCAQKVGNVLPSEDQCLGIDTVSPIKIKVRQWMGTVDLATFIQRDECPYTIYCELEVTSCVCSINFEHDLLIVSKPFGKGHNAVVGIIMFER